MTIREQIERLDELIDFVENELPDYAHRVAANDLAALVAKRVIETGTNYKGGKFSPYSSNQIPAYKFWGKSRNQTAERKVRNLSKARGALSYGEFRELNNLLTRNKNFEFFGEMWKKFGVVSYTNSGGRFKVVIGGQTDSAQRKIDENSDREGISIIEANEQEIALMQATTQAWLEQQADRILNG